MSLRISLLLSTFIMTKYKPFAYWEISKIFSPIINPPFFRICPWILTSVKLASELINIVVKSFVGLGCKANEELL